MGSGMKHHLGTHRRQPAVSREQRIIEIAGAGDDGRDRYRFQGQGLFFIDRRQLVPDDLKSDGVHGERFIQCIPIGKRGTQHIIIFVSHITPPVIPANAGIQ